MEKVQKKNDAMKNFDHENQVEKVMSQEEILFMHKQREQEEKMKEEMQMVTGVFRNNETPGAEHSFPFRKYGDEVLNFEFRDGEEYTIPLVVARHLNNNCAFPVYTSAKVATTKNNIRNNKLDVKEWIRRFSFTASSYVR